MEKTIHQGRNVKRFREMLGIKQEGLALELGDDWNQKKISLLEQKEVIEPELLEQIANALKVPAEAIRNFDEEAAISFIGNTFTNNDNSATLNGYTIHYNPTFNPIDKWVEAIEENKRLYTELLKEKDEKIALLEKMLGEKKK
jgi:transcriptional regulator with XRE-family HTH domain